MHFQFFLVTILDLTSTDLFALLNNLVMNYLKNYSVNSTIVIYRAVRSVRLAIAVYASCQPPITVLLFMLKLMQLLIGKSFLELGGNNGGTFF